MRYIILYEDYEVDSDFKKLSKVVRKFFSVVKPQYVVKFSKETDDCFSAIEVLNGFDSILIFVLERYIIRIEGDEEELLMYINERISNSDVESNHFALDEIDKLIEVFSDPEGFEIWRDTKKYNI